MWMQFPWLDGFVASPLLDRLDGFVATANWITVNITKCSRKTIRHCRGSSPTVLGLVEKMLGNSADKLCHTRYVAYSVVLVLLNKHQISYLHYYQMLFHPWVNFPDSADYSTLAHTENARFPNWVRAHRTSADLVVEDLRWRLCEYVTLNVTRSAR